MPSIFMHQWKIDRIPALDEPEAMHQGIGGSSRGRRYTTEQINQAYAVLLSSHFQGFCRELYEDSSLHMSEEEMIPRGDYSESAAVPSKPEIAEFLIHGRLASILRTNRASGRYVPRVWLRPDSLGGVTSKLDKEWGVLGGACVLEKAIEDQMVIASKREEVVAFLQNDNFDRSEAEKIVAAVGISPRPSTRKKAGGPTAS